MKFEQLRVAAETKRLPRHLQHVHEIFQVLVDYILVVLTFALPPKEYKLPNTNNEFENFYEPYSNLARPQWIKGPWAVTVISDERHSLAEIIKQCVYALGISTDSAVVWAKELEDIVRDTLSF